MGALQLIPVAVVFVLLVAGIKWYIAQLNGSAHYKRYPAASLLDDAAKQGKLVSGGTETLVRRIAASVDVAAEVKKVRAELGLPEA